MTMSVRDVFGSTCIVPSPSAWLCGHLDRVARASFEAHGATRAPIVQVTVRAAGAELRDRLLRTRSVALVAFEAVSARQAALCFERRSFGAESGLHFTEGDEPVCDRQPLLHGLLGVAVDGQVQHFEGNERVLGRSSVLTATQPGIDVSR